MHPTRAAGLWALTIIVALPLTACIKDEQIVYRDRPFNQPPAIAAGYLGYDDAEAKLTVCGNCHVGQQAQWETSAHSDAFATLAGSGGMQGFCQACHTVTELGNPQTDTAVGFRTTRDERYHDVQCESCHGPGLEHVTNPDATQPLASIAADTIATTGCGECHSGVHNPFIKEWRRSGHGRLVSSSTATSSANCVGCHTAQGALNRWGERANYVERGGAALPQTCAVCHDPHGSPNTKQLRHPIDSPDENRNLCMQCHNRRGTPDLASSASGPHAPEGPTLMGFAGWWPPSMEVPGDTAFLATHGSARNPRLCATCHVERYEIRDTLTDDFLMQVTGHSFLATPCVDANGIPTGARECDRSQRRYEACAASGCHASGAFARTLHTDAEDEIEALVAQLRAMLATRPPSDTSRTDGRYTTAEGSWFNVKLAEAPGAVVHNATLISALLRASIAQMQRDYGLPAVQLPPPSPEVRAFLGRASARAYQQSLLQRTSFRHPPR